MQVARGLSNPQSGDFSVNGTTGRIRLTAGGANRAIFLGNTAPHGMSPPASRSTRHPRAEAPGSTMISASTDRTATGCYARFASDGTTSISASRVVNGSRDADRQPRRHPGRQLPHGIHAPRSAHRHQPDHDQDQGVERQRAREPGNTPPPTAPARKSQGEQDCAATPPAATRTRRSRSRSTTTRPHDVAPPPPPPPPPPPSAAATAARYDVTFVGAGDIASSGSGDDATANLLDASRAPCSPRATTPIRTARRTIHRLLRADLGPPQDRTVPVVGNHEYNTGSAQAYFDYFGAAAGDPAKGYYSTDLGRGTSSR